MTFRTFFGNLLLVFLPIEVMVTNGQLEMNGTSPIMSIPTSQSRLNRADEVDDVCNPAKLTRDVAAVHFYKR